MPLITDQRKSLEQTLQTVRTVEDQERTKASILRLREFESQFQGVDIEAFQSEAITLLQEVVDNYSDVRAPLRQWFGPIGVRLAESYDVRERFKTTIAYR